MDRAKITIVSHTEHAAAIYGISTECFKCHPQLIANISKNENHILQIDARWGFKFLVEFSNGSTTVLQRLESHFLEYGNYQMNISSPTDIKISLLNSPLDGFIPYNHLAFYIFLGVLFGISVLWPTLKLLIRTYRKHYKEDNYFMEMEEWTNKVDSLSKRNDITIAKDIIKRQEPKTKRLRSLDTFRGTAIVLMIFVNYSGGHFYFIDHAIWNGLNVADLVFPCFIFIMGTSIVLSYNSIIKRQTKLTTALWHILVRSVKLVIIGLVLNMGKNLSTWRIPGVLQRFGVCYFVVASLNLLTSPSEAKLQKWKSSHSLTSLRDVLPYWIQWLFIILIGTVHTAITFLLEVPGCPKGYLGPGGLADHGKYYNCTGGAAGYIDRVVLGNSHLYAHPSCKEIYKTVQHFDPEGLLGILPSIVSTFLGLQAGRVLFSYEKHSSRVKRWVLWALITAAIGFGLTLSTKDSGIIPINKNLWSLSFVFATASISFCLFCLCYLLCDVYRVWNGSPFFFCGMNAIFLYVGHMCVPFNVFWHKDPQSHTSYLVVASFNTVVWATWAYILYEKKLFFTV